MVLPGFPGAVKSARRGSRYGKLIIRFQAWGCKNRPFYHIVVDKVLINCQGILVKDFYFRKTFRIEDRLAT